MDEISLKKVILDRQGVFAPSRINLLITVS